VNLIDAVLLGLLGTSALVGLLRGFGRELMSLVSWVLAVVIAARAVPHLIVYLDGLLGSALLEQVLVFVAVFMVVVLLGALVNGLIGALLRRSGFSGIDRVFGVVFGVARAGVLSAALFYAAGLTSWPAQTVWQESAAIAAIAPVLCEAGLQARLQRLQPTGWLAEWVGDSIDWGAVCREADTLGPEPGPESDPQGL
jgi:membrane protein required for colicin V production